MIIEIVYYQIQTKKCSVIEHFFVFSTLYKYLRPIVIS